MKNDFPTVVKRLLVVFIIDFLDQFSFQFGSFNPHDNFLEHFTFNDSTVLFSP